MQEATAKPGQQITIPKAFQDLFKPFRYKVYYGGRSGAKSESFARALLLKARDEPLRILCTREVQKSIKDSVYRLLCDIIQLYDWGDYYEITSDQIRGKNGSLFIFAGLKNTVIDNVKSYAGIDIVWVEEAHIVSKRSWDILTPTIRKENSEIWVSFNPELQTDEAYRRFVLNNPPDALVAKVGWQDNPFHNSVMENERLYCKSTDPENYNHIWEGSCKTAVHGAIFGRELQKAESEGRITYVPYNPNKPVHVVFDLGWADCTSLWFFQFIGFETHFIRFMQSHQQTMNWYLQEMQTFGYTYDTLYLPHDARNQMLASGGRSIEQIVRNLGHKCRVLEKAPIADTINATRNLFANMWFDANHCEEGLNLLRRYKYDVDPDTNQFSKNPKHDDASHCGDAMRMFSMVVDTSPKGLKKPAYKRPHEFHGDWTAI